MPSSRGSSQTSDGISHLFYLLHWQEGSLLLGSPGKPHSTHIVHLKPSLTCCTSAQFSSVHLLSVFWLFATPWTAALQASLSFWRLLKLMSIELVMPSNHLILCCPLLLLPSIFPRMTLILVIRVISKESVLPIRWPKYWSFNFSISPSNEHSVLISFKIDWFVLAHQGTLKSLPQQHSLKASILCCSAFFIVQLLHPYGTTGKTIAVTRWTFVGKGMSLLFNKLSRLVIAFLPRSTCLLLHGYSYRLQWFWSPKI